MWLGQLWKDLLSWCQSVEFVSCKSAVPWAEFKSPSFANSEQSDCPDWDWSQHRPPRNGRGRTLRVSKGTSAIWEWRIVTLKFKKYILFQFGFTSWSGVPKMFYSNETWYSGLLNLAWRANMNKNPGCSNSSCQQILIEILIFTKIFKTFYPIWTSVSYLSQNKF